MKLKVQSSKDWLQCVLADFETFLQDHAANERKASSMAMSM
ncbi:MAG TPA: tRNA-(ms[2]io[6]A)-hydroxylase, partial [Gammaproteobacteria bacterium]|nr:tRNA-(ms[2]io[6]A)-hydroxylase [Gammaproteobacteria bacterium]